MDLSFITESVIDTTEEVESALDMMYIKNLTILEAVDDLNILKQFNCFQESTAPVTSSELNVFKFDNSHILKAIKYFNKAYAEIPFERTNFDEIKQKQETGNLDIDYTFFRIKYPPSLIDDVTKRFRTPGGYFDKGFIELQKQFDCKYKIYVSTNTSTGTIVLPVAVLKDPGKLTISKSKGFQLGGLDIMVNINVKELLTIVPANKNLFGQSLVAIILHETYHNIMRMVEVRNSNLHKGIDKLVADISDKETVDSSKTKITSFIDKFEDSFSIKDSDIKDKNRMVNRFFVLSKIKDNPTAIKKFESDIKNNADPTITEKELDAYIDGLKRVKDKVIIKRAKRLISAACAILLAGLGFVFGSAALVVSGIVGVAIMSLALLKKKVLSLLGLAPRVQEEYFCDLFASMYKLPIHLSSFNRQIKLNKANATKVSQIHELNQSIDKKVKDVHPLTFDRELTSYKVAKQILESGQKLKKPEREYLQYIVNLHEGIEDINNPYSERQQKKLDPEAAADLQKTLNDFISKTGVAVTESFNMRGDDDGS